MLGVKRKLFPESTTSACSDMSLITTTTSRSRRPDRYRVGKSKYNTSSSSSSHVPVSCDSLLATALLDKSNNISVKTRRTKHQRNTNSTINQDNPNANNTNKNNLREPSVLMVLDARKNNTTLNHNKVQRKSTQRHQKGNVIQTAATKYIENQKMPPNSLGGITSCVAVNGRVRPSQQKPSTNLPRKHSKQRRKNIVFEKVCPKISIQNGDSLIMCTTKGSSTDSFLKPKAVINESVLVQTEFTNSTENEKMYKKQPKNCFNRRSKRTRKRQIKVQSSNRKSAKKSIVNRKPGDKTKRSAIGAASQVGGLGAFAGITSRTRTAKDFTKEPSTRRFVSPLENDLSKISAIPFNKRPLKKGVVVETPISEDGPPIMTVIIPQQSEPISSLKCQETITSIYNSANKHKPIGLTSTVSAPKEVKGKQQNPQFNKQQYGWSTEEIISCNSEKGFYNGRYGDRNGEKLEENEIQSVSLLGTKLNKEQHTYLKFKNYGDLAMDRNDNNRVRPLVGPPFQTEPKNKMLKAFYKKDKKSSQPLKESATLRRSKRRSSPPIRLLYPAHTIERGNSPWDLDDKHTSTRRSKRRSIQPIRLIDCAYTEVKEGNNNASKKKRKRSTGRNKAKSKRNSNREKTKKRKIDRPHNKLERDEESSIFEKKHVNNNNQFLVSGEDIALSPSNCAHECPRKQQFDDALKAIMPQEDVEQLARDSGQYQDDIFNATPMRKLFMKNDSPLDIANFPVEKEEEEHEPKRRPTRRSIQLERYDGTYVDSVSTTVRKNKKNIKSSLKKKKFNNDQDKSRVKKRVRILDEAHKESSTDICIISNEDYQWTSANLKALHKANRTVDPKSFTFWEDVSEIVGEKSTMECREKWFSLVNTPVMKRKAKKKNDAPNTILAVLPSGTLNTLDDDIFNATPMRGIFTVGEFNDSCDTTFDEIDDLSNMVVGSAIKLEKVEPSNTSLQTNKGYKTYIQNMGRNMRQKDKKEIHNENKSSNHPMKIGKNLAERVDEGDVEVKCKLSPGGTLQVDTYGGTDTEDYFDYDDE